MDDYGLTASGLSPELQPEAYALMRRQKIADALLSRSQQPLTTQSSGRYLVPTSPLAALASVLGSGLAAKQGADVESGFKDLQGKQRAGVADAIAAYQNGMQDRTVRTIDQGAMTGTLDSQDAPIRTETVKADPRAAVTALLANQYAPKPLQQMAVADLTRRDTQAYQDKVRTDTQAYKSFEAGLTRDQQLKLLDLKLANAGTPEERQQYALEKIALQNQGKEDAKLGDVVQVKMPDGSVRLMTKQQMREFATGGAPAAPVAAPTAAGVVAPTQAPAAAPSGIKLGQGSPTDRMRILTDELAAEQARTPTSDRDKELQAANIAALQREIGSVGGTKVAQTLPGASLGTKSADPRYDPEAQRKLAAAKAGGKIEGTNQANSQNQLPQLEAQTQQSLRLVDELIAHTGKKLAVGSASMLGLKHIPGTPAADFMNRLDQIKGQQFMTAYQILKGGGQITEIEGKKGTDALARMNTSSSIDEFDKAAREFKDVLTQGLARAKQQAATVQSPGAATGAPRVVDW